MDRFSINVFSNEWFEFHQDKLLFLVNDIPFISTLVRQKLNIDTNNKITKLVPNGWHYIISGDDYAFKCYSNNTLALAMKVNFEYIWKTLHFWDMSIANNISPKLNFGFDTLTAYQNVGTGGGIEFYNSDTTGGSSITYIRGNASINADSIQYYIGLWSASTVDRYWIVIHPYYQSTTSSIGSSSTITSASQYFYPSNGDSSDAGAGYGLGACLYQGAGAITTSGSWGTSNWGSNVWTRFSDSGNDISMSTMIGRRNTQYESIPLNATGLAAINKNGNTHIYLGLNKIVDNTTITWQGNQIYEKMTIYTEAQAGTSNDPYLFITYTPVSTARKQRFYIH